MAKEQINSELKALFESIKDSTLETLADKVVDMMMDGCEALGATSDEDFTHATETKIDNIQARAKQVIDDNADLKRQSLGQAMKQDKLLASPLKSDSKERLKASIAILGVFLEKTENEKDIAPVFVGAAMEMLVELNFRFQDEEMEEVDKMLESIKAVYEQLEEHSASNHALKEQANSKEKTLKERESKLHSRVTETPPDEKTIT